MALLGHTAARMALAMVAGVAACGRGTKPIERGTEAADQVLLRKLDAYVACDRDHSKRVFAIGDLYRNHFKGAPPTSETAIVLAPPDDPKPCLEAIAIAKTLAPSLPELEAAGGAYGASLATVHQITASYAAASAAEVHSRLLSAFDAFDHAQGALFDQIYVLNRNVHLAQFAERERKAPDALDTLIERTYLAAEDLVRFAAVPASELDKLDVRAVRTSLAAFESSVEALRRFEVRDPKNVPDPDRLERIRASALKLALAARVLARRAADRTPYTEAEKLLLSEGYDAEVVGSPAALAFAYNSLLEAGRET